MYLHTLPRFLFTDNQLFRCSLNPTLNLLFRPSNHVAPFSPPSRHFPLFIGGDGWIVLGHELIVWGHRLNAQGYFAYLESSCVCQA